MNYNPTVPLDKQQLYLVGDVVLRRTDLSGMFWKRGTITAVTEGVGGNNYPPTYFYCVLWDDGTAGENYMGSSLVPPGGVSALVDIYNVLAQLGDVK